MSVGVGFWFILRHVSVDSNLQADLKISVIADRDLTGRVCKIKTVIQMTRPRYLDL